MNDVTTSRPQHVTTAVIILGLALIYGLVVAAVKVSLVMPPETPQMVATVGMAFALVTFCIGAFFIFMIFKGKNWARIIFLILFILGAVFALPTAIGMFQRAPVMGMLSLIGLAARIVALVLLFTAASNEWFRKPVSSTETETT